MKAIHYPIAVLAVIAVAVLSGCSNESSQDGHGASGGGEAVEVPVPKIEFLTPEEGVEVERDYNQRVFVPVRNNGPGVASLRLHAQPFDDLPSGFVGRGTPDWEVPDTRLEIPPGEVWEAPLLVHGNRARQNEYTLRLEASHRGVKEPAGTGALTVRLAAPKLELQTTWLHPSHPPDRARLRRILRIRNAGAVVPDLSLRFEIDGQLKAQSLVIDPVVEATRLAGADAIDVVIGPHLFPSFTELRGEIVLSGLNQELRVPYVAAVPEGESVFVALSRTTSRASNGGSRCTNSPGSTYTTPPTNGTPEHWGGGGRTERTDSDDEGEKEDEGWTLFGYEPENAAGAAEPGGSEEEEPRAADSDKEGDNAIAGTGDGKENSADDGTFDHLDANSEDLIGGFIPPKSLGGRPPAGPLAPVIKHDILLADDEVPWVVKKGEEPSQSPESGRRERAAKESSTHADERGRRTHLTRRRNASGAEFLNFGFEMEPGRRKKLPVRLGYPISQPRLGPNPRADAPAVAAYTKRNADGRTVVEVLDPDTGTKAELSDPSTDADTPVVIRNGKRVESLFREGGVIRRVSLGEDLSAQPDAKWPSGEETGPILQAVPGPDGALALLTREADGRIALRKPDAVRTFRATDASLARTDGELHLALGKEDGTVEVIDPESDVDQHVVPGNGYGPPALVHTADGGLRLFLAKPLTPLEELTDGSTGLALGGNFAAEFKDGSWSAPKRIYLPDSPVRDAAVAVEFTPPFAKAHYKRMDTALTFNGRRLATLKDMVPAGRYVFRVPTTALHYANSAGPADARPNRLVINARGIGPGNYHFTDRCTVYARHDWTQGCYVTTTAGEAERLAQQSSGDLSHEMHDLVIATNGAQLPRDVQPGQRATLTIAVFNAGDVPSPAMPLTVTCEGNPAGSGTVKSLPPFQGGAAELDITIPSAWRQGSSLRLTVSAPTDGDADPASNSLDLYLLKEFQRSIAGPTAPVRVDVSALPEEAVTEVVIRGDGAPFEAPLRTGSVWFRTVVAESGNLQVEVAGTGTPLVDRIDLFDTEGHALDGSGAAASAGTPLYIRVGLPPERSLPDDTRLRVWWE